LADTFLLKAVDLTTTNATQIYKVPITDDTATPPTASTTALVKSILVSEDSNNADTITITITRDNVDSDPVFSVFKDKAVGAKGTVELLTQPLVLQEGKKTEYKQENGQIITVVQPEVYQRIYCKNCNNEVDSEEEATGTCKDCGKPWAEQMAKDITVKVIEMPPMGSESGE
jgi:Zn finger protein HypA/HybF involved in hydrogenase expression